MSNNPPKISNTEDRTFCEAITFDKLVKSQREAPRWLEKKFDIRPPKEVPLEYKE